MTSVIQPLAISLAVATLFSSSSFAQTAAQSATDVNDNLQTVIVTAGRQPQLAKDVLADNLVITADEIARSGASTVVDLLQQQRGIEISRNGGAGSAASVFIRGSSNAQNVVLVDGVRIGSSTLGGATWAAIPLSQIDRIEIVYGPLSSLYGADAVGGVIQIFTKKGSQALLPTVSVGAGSYGLRQAQAGISGALAQDVTASFNIAHEEADGFSASKPSAGLYTYNADKDGYVNDSASGRLAWQIAPGHALELQFLQSRINAQFDSGAGYDDRNVLKLETIAVTSKNKLTSDWTSELSLAQSKDKSFTDASYGKSQIDTRQQNLSWQNAIRFDKDVLQLIAEHRDEQVDAISAIKGSRITNSLAASYVLKRDAHLASASIRSDRSTQYGSHSTGSVAYGYRLTEALRVNASYGTSFRAPTFNELYYPSYGIASNKPESAKNTEIGAYFDDGTTQASAVYFQTKASDLLVYANVCPVQVSTHPYGCAYNVNEATLSGITLGASTMFAGVKLRGSLDIQDPKDDTTGKLLARRAKQHGSVAVEQVLGTFTYGVETLFSGSRFDDAGNTHRLGGYSVLNLYVNSEIAPNLFLLGRWNNVLNKDYELAQNYATAGRNGFVGLRYVFK